MGFFKQPKDFCSFCNSDLHITINLIFTIAGDSKTPSPPPPIDYVLAHHPQNLVHFQSSILIFIPLVLY